MRSIFADMCASSARRPTCSKNRAANATLLGVQRALTPAGRRDPWRGPDRAAPLGARVCPHARRLLLLPRGARACNLLALARADRRGAARRAQAERRQAGGPVQA
jgi:hypothetical protein